MKASVQQTHKKSGKENQELTKINEECEMKASTDKGQNKLAAVYQEISKFKEDIAMNCP